MKAQPTPANLDDALAAARWMCCAGDPGRFEDPALLSESERGWFPAEVPGTVAAALHAQGRWDHQHPPDIDAQDWWYRTTFQEPVRPAGTPCFLCLDGLASRADVWLNGDCLLSTDNMFRAYRVDVTYLLKTDNELLIVFHSLTADLKKKRPRPRWKTNLTSHQQLRWHRTSLLGRIPGWTPPVPPVGAWRAVRLECGPVLLSQIQRTAGLEGDCGIVSFSAQVTACVAIISARLLVGEQETALSCDGSTLEGTLRLPDAERWWPHTHGHPRLHDCKVVIETELGIQEFILERIGFRQLERQDDPGFSLSINGEPVYCRGACWTACDIFTLSGTGESLRHDLQLARDAGMNMVRIGGTMIYESDEFYRLCDELGLLVWQDFMFANMDYPVEDDAFARNIALEAQQQIDRLAQHPCVAVYCGNSEVEQQASMLGMPREVWRNDWLARICRPLPDPPSGHDLRSLLSQRRSHALPHADGGDPLLRHWGLPALPARAAPGRCEIHLRVPWFCQHPRTRRD